jgi:UrcA family protein
MIAHTASPATITRIVVAALVAIAVGTPAAFAQVPVEDGKTRTVTVKYSDLNLSTEEGSRTLYGRLLEAALQVCPERSDTLLALRQDRDSQRCVTDAIQRAVDKIKDPKFAQVAAARMR